jgi:hypothetical protein
MRSGGSDLQVREREVREVASGSRRERAESESWWRRSEGQAKCSACRADSAVK